MTEVWVLDIAGSWNKVAPDEWFNQQNGVSMTDEPEFNADEITGQYLYVRNARAARSAAAAKDDAVFKEELTRLEGIMGKWLDKVGLKTAPCVHGTFYKEVEILPAADDWDTFYEWIKEHDAFQFLHKRITAVEVSKYMEAHKDEETSLPPGIRVEKKWKVIVRATTAKAGEK